MKVFDFINFMFEKGFSFTNEGKTQFFHKKEAKNKVFAKSGKIEVQVEIYDIPENENNAELILKLPFSINKAKREEKTQHKRKSGRD